MMHRFAFHCALLFLCLLAGCAGYDVTINERVVFRPDPLFADFEVEDVALDNCLRETIAAGAITRPEQLKALNCSHAGITDLQGLATFTGLQQLRLSFNDIRNLVELEKLDKLSELYLDNNRIIDPVPLYQLPHLTHVDLSGNPGLQCPRDAGFSAVDTVLLPQHCP